MGNLGSNLFSLVCFMVTNQLINNDEFYHYIEFLTQLQNELHFHFPKFDDAFTDSLLSS